MTVDRATAPRQLASLDTDVSPLKSNAHRRNLCLAVLASVQRGRARNFTLWHPYQVRGG